MSEYNWTEYSKIKSDFDLKKIKSLFDSLISLLNGIHFKNDCKVLKSVSKRITIRLRSAKVCRLIKHTKRCLDQFFVIRVSETMVENLSSLVNECYDISSGCIVLPVRQQIESVLTAFIRSAQILRKTILVSMNAFCCCYQWLRSGNLAPHFLMMSSSLSRLNFICKAIVVYINDLYSPLIAIKDVLKEKESILRDNISFPESLEEFLTDIDIKLEKKVIKTEVEIKSSDEEITEEIAEDIGVAIERTEESQPKKEKNKNKSNQKTNKKKNKLKLKPKQINQTKPQKHIQMRKKKRKN